MGDHDPSAISPAEWISYVFDEILKDDDLAEKAGRVLDHIRERAKPPERIGLIPSKAYRRSELVEPMGLTLGEIEKIPEEEMPCIRVGKRRGAVRVRGFAAERYMEGFPPLDHKKRLSGEPKQPTRILPMNGGKKARMK